MLFFRFLISIHKMFLTLVINPWFILIISTLLISMKKAPSRWWISCTWSSYVLNIHHRRKELNYLF